MRENGALFQWALKRTLTSVIAREGVVLAGTTNGVFRSDDRGHTWVAASAGLSIQYVRWMAFNPDISDFEFAGTEPAALRDLHKWFSPYSNNAGCIRGFALNGSRAYAAAEVGGVLRSDNGGELWRLAPGSNGNSNVDGPPEPHVYPDVHSVEVHPSSANRVYAATGGGLYISLDDGEKWKCAYDCYSRAVWVDPGHLDHLVLGSAEGVSRGGKIEETTDGGRSWRLASQGLDVPWKNHMVERIMQIRDTLFAILSSGELITATLGSLNWAHTLQDVGHITCVTAMRMRIAGRLARERFRWRERVTNPPLCVGG